MYQASPVTTFYRAIITIHKEEAPKIIFNTVQIGDCNRYIVNGTEWKPTKVEAIQVLKDRFASEAFRCGDILPGAVCEWLSSPEGKKAIFDSLTRREPPPIDPLIEYPITVKKRRRSGNTRYRRKSG